MLKLLCVFLCNFLFIRWTVTHQSKQTLHQLFIYTVREGQEHSAFEAQLVSVFLSSMCADFFFHVPLVFLNSLKNTRVINFFFGKKETKQKTKCRKQKPLRNHYPAITISLLLYICSHLFLYLYICSFYKSCIWFKLLLTCFSINNVL